MASGLQAELNAGTSADASNIGKATAQDQAVTQQMGSQQTSGQQTSGEQTSGQQNGQPSNIDLLATAVSVTTVSASTGSTAKLTAAQLLIAAQTVSHPTGKSGKQQAQTSAGTSVDAASNLVSVPSPAETLQSAKLPTGLVSDSQTPSNPVQAIDGSSSGSNQDGAGRDKLGQTGAGQADANRDRHQLAAASTSATSDAQQIASQQAAANAAQAVHNSFATALTATAQADAPSQADDAGVNSGNGATGTQTANQGSKSQANLAGASTFLSASILPNTIDPSQSSGAASQYKTSAATFNSNPNVSGTANGTSVAKSSLSDASGSSSQSAQTGSDPTQHLQAAASQSTAVAARPADNAAAQAITLGAQAAPHQTASASTATASASGSAHRSGESAGLASEQLNTAGSGATSGINSARVIQSMSETEMRVGMRSSEFGDISIRTMVTQQQMQAQISVDHNELSNAIAAHIPAIQAKLGNEYGLHASIEVSQGGTSFSSGERGQSSQKDQKSFTPSVQIDSSAVSSDTDRLVLRAPLVAAAGDRLDIRA